MIHMEKKLDAVMRCLAGGTYAEREQARQEISKMLAAQDAPPAKRGIEYEVRRILTEIGVPENILGHRYLVCAICLAVNDPGLLDSVVKGLYTQVAEAFHTTPSRAERCIRHAIEVAWGQRDLDTLMRYFGNTISPAKGKPTNAQFVAKISNMVRQYAA